MPRDSTTILPKSWISRVFRVSESREVRPSSLIGDLYKLEVDSVGSEKGLSIVSLDKDQLEISTTSFYFEEDKHHADVSDASTSSDSSICVDNKVETSDDEIHTHLLRGIADELIGRNAPFESPFGIKAQCYADYTASGKLLKSIEQFMRDKVMPTYGNTHTTTSVTGLQTTAFREEARQIIAKAVHACELKDAVLFAGHGCTSAIQKLIMALGINSSKRSRCSFKRPVVFTCPFAHHSNLLPWRESLAADIVEIPEANGGGLDVKELEHQLKLYSNRKVKIGTFTAAANLTGILMDVNKISKVLHRHGALAFWDYATCAPYVEIDMNPTDPLAYKDAIFFSGHKFVGGPGSPGVLVVKKKLMQNEVPTMPGCGTVLFVTEQSQNYLNDIVSREEGGTPDIMGSIQLGLAFTLKQRVGTDTIMAIERWHVQRVRASLGKNPHIVLLGGHLTDMDQLPIFSMMVRYGDRFLHHNFVCALLNDLFGIQARGGCQCAGPYAARLLGISKEHTTALGNAFMERDEVIKPGVVRMSFPYCADDAEVEYILDAMNFVADHGWKYLPQYKLNTHSASWRHTSCIDDSSLSKSCRLEFESFSDGAICSSPRNRFAIDCIATHRRENLEQAALQADLSIKEAALLEFFAEGQKLLQTHEWLRWFVYPYEVVAHYKTNSNKVALTAKITGPCQPQLYLNNATNHIWDEKSSMTKRNRSRMKRLMQFMPTS